MIALLTDFGLSDIYVGVMKTVIAGIAPNAVVIDLTHDIPAQNIEVGALQIAGAWDYLPEKAVLVAVVDPGVGGTRRAVAVECGGRFFVGPDNGLLSRVMEKISPTLAVELTNARYQVASRRGETFHGRDVFAPVAAHIASGMMLARLGTMINPGSLIRLRPTSSPCSASEPVCSARVALIDRFGNIVLDIGSDAFALWRGGSDRFVVKDFGSRWSYQLTYASSYSLPSEQSLLLVANSYGLVEIAKPTGSAAKLLPVVIGEILELIRTN